MEHKLNGKVLLAIDVPEDANSFIICENDVVGGNCLMCKPKPNYAHSFVTNIPSGQWQILGIAGQLDESICRGLVKRRSYGVTMGVYYSTDDVREFKTALESWQSFMKSENIPQNYLILTKG